MLSGRTVIFRKSCLEFNVVYLGVSSQLGLVQCFLLVSMSQQVCLLVSCLPIGCQNWSLVPLEYGKVNYFSLQSDDVKLECSVCQRNSAYCYFFLSPLSHLVLRQFDSEVALRRQIESISVLLSKNCFSLNLQNNLDNPILPILHHLKQSSSIPPMQDTPMTWSLLDSPASLGLFCFQPQNQIFVGYFEWLNLLLSGLITQLTACSSR